MRHIKKITIFFLIFALFAALFTLAASALEVIPGGDAVAMRLQSEGVIVLGFTDEDANNPGRQAGLKRGDRILRIGESDVLSVDALTGALNGAQGSVPLTYLRGKKEFDTTVTPRVGEDGCGRLGLLVKDSTAGIGTLTFVLPEEGLYGCLGHGITDPDTETVFRCRRGDLYPASVTAIRKSAAGAPGELQGAFGAKTWGTVTKNCPEGIYGTLDASVFSQRETLPVAEKSEVKEGEATIRCTLDDGGIREYDVEITRVYRLFGGSSKNMLLRITDPDLLEKTGGIVQGMSGSPIIQNGKIIGAVTHVLVNDPTAGYGIFLENMLKSAENAA